MFIVDIEKLIEKIFVAIVAICVGYTFASEVHSLVQEKISSYLNPVQEVEFKKLNSDEIQNHLLEDGEIFIRGEFKVKYNEQDRMYSLYTRYNTSIPMNFYRYDSVRVAMTAFKELGYDNKVEYVDPSINIDSLNLCKNHLYECYKINDDICFMARKSLVSNKTLFRMRLKYITFSFTIDAEQSSIFIEEVIDSLKDKNKSFDDFIIDGHDVEFSNVQLRDSKNVRKTSINNNSDTKSISRATLEKELALVPDKLMDALKGNTLNKIVSNSTLLDTYNSKYKNGYKAGGVYFRDSGYILLGGEESDINWATLHEVGHSFYYLEELSLNFNKDIRKSYETREIKFNSDYYYQNLNEYIAETFSYKMLGLLDEDSMINKGLDKILKKYK